MTTLMNILREYFARSRSRFGVENVQKLNLKTQSFVQELYAVKNGANPALLLNEEALAPKLAEVLKCGAG